MFVIYVNTLVYKVEKLIISSALMNINKFVLPAPMQYQVHFRKRRQVP